MSGTPITRVALAGATGNLGPHILKALLGADFEVTVLSREGSNSTDSLPQHPKQKIVKVNYQDVSALATSLNGIDAVVSNLNGPALALQRGLIDASIAAGVRRFIPSEFGSDSAQEELGTLPFYSGKKQSEQYLEAVVTRNVGFSYTLLINGPFLDWCIDHKVLADVESHTVTFWDGGDHPFSTTTLPSVGRAVAAILKHEQETKNRAVYVQDTVMTQKRFVDLAKSIDGQEWTITHGDTAAAKKAAIEELSKPEPNMMFSIINQLNRAIFSREGNQRFKKTDNELLGLPQMTDAQVKEVVKTSMAK